MLLSFSKHWKTFKRKNQLSEPEIILYKIDPRYFHQIHIILSCHCFKQSFIEAKNGFSWLCYEFSFVLSILMLSNFKTSSPILTKIELNSILILFLLSLELYFQGAYCWRTLSLSPSRSSREKEWKRFLFYYLILSKSWIWSYQRGRTLLRRWVCQFDKRWKKMVQMEWIERWGQTQRKNNLMIKIKSAAGHSFRMFFFQFIRQMFRLSFNRFSFSFSGQL